jgi:hypothetical protein
MAAEMENDQRKSVRKLAQAHDVSARTIHALSRLPEAFKEVGQGGQPNGFPLR